MEEMKKNAPAKKAGENKMAVMPVSKLMVNMSVPIILSMMMQALYNIVDSAFVSNMKENSDAAMNALTLVFPLQMLMVGVAVGTGVGVNALLSKSLGQGDNEKANRVAGNGIFLGIVVYIVFLLFGIFGVNTYITSQVSDATSATTIDMATSYLRICCVVSFGVILYPIYEKLLQATGRSVYSTIAQMAGALTNIVLDPIMIYGLLGCPKMGVDGAAYATVIGQIVSAVLGLVFHLALNKEIKNSLKYYIPSWKLIKEIYAIGLPAIIAQALTSVMTYGLNLIFVQVSVQLQTAYGLYYKIQQFVLFAAFGMRDGVTPIVSFNHGLGSKKRIKEGIKYGLIDVSVIMIAGILIIEIFATPFSKIFGMTDTTTINLFIEAMHFVTLSFLFAGINIVFQGIFQALNGGMESLIISVCRQFLFIFPLAYAFSKVAMESENMTWLIWMTFLIAEFVTMIIGIFLLKRNYKKQVSVLKDEA